MSPPPLKPSGAPARGELRWRTWCCLVALPAVALGILMAIYGVDLPAFDQWIAIAPLLEKTGDGTLRLDDILALHNEHRLVIPRLIFLPLAMLTHWNGRLEMYLVWVTLLGVAANWWSLLRATGWTAGRAAHAMYALMGLLVFHTLQFENVLSGFQFHFILPIFFISAGLWVAMALPAPRNFIGVMALATAATFSSAQGLLSWPLLLPVLWLRARRGAARWWLAYALVGGVNVALYFRGYASPGKHPPPHDVGEAVGYLLAYLGSPFADGRLLPAVEQAQWCGFVLLLLFGGAAAAVGRRRRDAAFLARALPWLMAGSLALGTAALTALGRAGFGPVQAFETRYTTYATVLPIALLPLGVLILGGGGSKVKTLRRRWVGWAAWGAATCLLALHFIAQGGRLPLWTKHRQQRLMAKAILETIHLGNTGAWGRFVSPAPDALERSAAALKRLDYLRVKPIETAAISGVGDPRSPGSVQYGRLIQPESGAQRSATIGGWAVLPERGEAADAVLLTYDDAAGQPTIFATTMARLDCRQAVAVTGLSELATSGWRVDLNATALPESAKVVKAWAYDAESGRAWRLAGQTVVER